MTEVLPKLITVFVLAMAELWAAVPAGLALGLPPVAVGIAAAAGAVVGAVGVALLGDRTRRWLLRQHADRGRGEPHGALRRVWERFGVVGLGLVAPLLVGAPLGTALGIVLGVPLGRLLAWMGVGIVLWSALLTGAGLPSPVSRRDWAPRGERSLSDE